MGGAALVTLMSGVLVPHGHADSSSPLTGLVDAAAQRLQIAEPVAAVKWNTHGAIEDPDRVRAQLDDLSAAARATARIDPGYVTRVFGDQIAATEAIEYSRFADWKLNPADVPGSPPDLVASRSAIERLNTVMVSQIEADWDVMHSPACPTQLDAARDEVVGARRLDGLYQRALAAATRSYCQG
ncbi:MAG: chorismate mutase [Mycobacterium sp.]